MYDVGTYDLDAQRVFEVCAQAAVVPVGSKAKRAMDILIAALLLLALAPVLIAVACCIRIESGGPALFRQRRGGRFGRTFSIYKFRTMVVMEDGERITQARHKDPRVTPLGAFLRKTSMDELPQLINVLKGEMSLVGPRPHAVAHDREFLERIPSYAQRFAMRPGITGLAQVRGFRGGTETNESLTGRVSADLEYIATWSLANDVRLLVATLRVPFDSSVC
jgi:lipopolysaccharide/colanic/teichoic acid biosynthesis glycosyltransferase